MRARNSAPDLGRHDGPRRARQKPDAQVGLEVGNDARGLGLRQAAFARGRRKAAEPGDTRIELEGEYVLHGADSVAPQRDEAVASLHD